MEACDQGGFSGVRRVLSQGQIFFDVSRVDSYSTLKTKSLGYFNMSVTICLSIRRNIPEDLILQQRRRQNFGFGGDCSQRPADRFWDLAVVKRLEQEPGHLPLNREEFQTMRTSATSQIRHHTKQVGPSCKTFVLYLGGVDLFLCKNMRCSKGLRHFYPFQFFIHCDTNIRQDLEPIV